MSAEDGGGDGPYRPRRVGPPGPAYNPPSRSWWRRNKQPKPPKPPKRPEQKREAPSEQPLPAEGAPPVQQAPPPPVQPTPPVPSQAPPAAAQPHAPPAPSEPPSSFQQPQAPAAQPQPPPTPREQAQPQPPPVDESQPPPGDEPEKSRKRRGRKVDYLVGIPLGLLLGIGIVTAFLFLGSEGTIDAPRVKDGGSTGTGGATGPRGSVRFSGPARPGEAGASGPSGEPGSATPSAGGNPSPPPTPAKPPVIRIEGSNPPLEAGAVKIEARKGVPVRFRIASDGPVSIEIVGTGFTRDVSDGEVVIFIPTRVGQFPTFVSGNDVNVATFDVSR